jgi:hypothetical protein
MDGGSAENAGAIFCPFILNIKKGKNPKALPFHRVHKSPCGLEVVGRLSSQS